MFPEAEDAPLDPAQLSREELEEHALALRTLLAISDAVQRSRDFDDLVERAVDAIVTYTRYPSVALFRVDEADRCVRLVAARGFSEETLRRAARLPLEGSLTGLAVTRGEVVTTGDLAHDARVDPSTRASLVDEGFLRVASVPLFFRDVPVGALNLIYKNVEGLPDHEKAMLMSIGRTIGMAMANRIAAEEQRRLEEQLRRTEQLESLGLLAGGIAHDFNNLLTGFLANVSLASRSLADVGPAAAFALERLAEAQNAALRSRALARQLLTFARGGAPVKLPTDRVGEIVREAAEFVVRGSSVRCEVEVAPDLGTMELDAPQIAQVIQNLVLNAAQASEEGATVRVEVRAVDLTAPRPPLSEGRWLEITVTDEGRGIPEAELSRVFDPYFTTRPEGTGLGLPTTRSIVHRHGGHIDVTSQVGRGTRFTIHLPAPPCVAPPPAVGDAEIPRGQGRVLVVDDDLLVRSVASQALAHFGYEPETAMTGAEGIAKYEEARREGRPFALVVLDLTIVGGFGGKETMSRLRAIDPSVRALVSSGYSADPVMADHASHGFVAVLEKPYTAETLARVVAAALRAPLPSGVAPPALGRHLRWEAFNGAIARARGGRVADACAQLGFPRAWRQSLLAASWRLLGGFLAASGGFLAAFWRLSVVTLAGMPGLQPISSTAPGRAG